MRTRDFTINSFYYDFVNKRLFHDMEDLDEQNQPFEILPFEEDLKFKEINWIPSMKSKIF
jgi:hypothetical protein